MQKSYTEGVEGTIGGGVVQPLLHQLKVRCMFFLCLHLSRTEMLLLVNLSEPNTAGSSLVTQGEVGVGRFTRVVISCLSRSSTFSQEELIGKSFSPHQRGSGLYLALHKLSSLKH